MKNLDKIDQRILYELQREGRLTNTELSERVHLSATATIERVRRLTRDGYILGYSAVLSPKMLNRNLIIFIEVKLELTTPDIFEAFAKAAIETEDLMECHMVAGGFDYLLKVRLPDMETYRSFLNDTILTLPGVRETHTYTVMEEVKNSREIPVFTRED